MKYRNYRLSKRNKIEIKVIDRSSPGGFATVTMDKDLYIGLLESGAKKFEIMSINGVSRLVYRKGLGIRINTVRSYRDMAEAARRMAISLNKIKRRNIDAQKKGTARY